MLEIALDKTESGVFQKDIAIRQNISVKYLDNIIASLKASGLIINKRGRKSGYRLSRPPAEISMLDIYKAFEPDITIVDCMEQGYDCQQFSTCGVRLFWEGLNNQITEYFRSFTLEDLIKVHKRRQ